MTLDQGIIGKTYVVDRFDLPEGIQRRLETLGMTPGIHVRILHAKRASTVIIRFRSQKFALGKGIIKGIHVHEAGQEGAHE